MRGREEEVGKEVLMTCFCVKGDVFPDLAQDKTSVSTLRQGRMRTLIKLVLHLFLLHTHTVAIQ